MGDIFGDRREELMAQLLEEDLDLDLSTQRRGVRYFAAGRSKDRRMFASFMFAAFEGDPNERAYREAIEDILRVAGGSVQARTRHKLSFDHGILYFTADDRGNMYGVVASEEYSMADAFKLLEAILDIYDGIDIATGLDKADSSLMKEKQFQDDLFGIRSRAADVWRRMSRPGDGQSYDSQDKAADPRLGAISRDRSPRRSPVVASI